MIRLSEKQLRAIFENLENGNLSDARQLAKGQKTFRLSMFARQILGWSFDRSFFAAHYLRTGEGFQNYCDCQ